MLFIFQTPELIRNLWQLKTAVFLHWCLIRAVLLKHQAGWLRCKDQVVYIRVEGSAIIFKRSYLDKVEIVSWKQLTIIDLNCCQKIAHCNKLQWLLLSVISSLILYIKTAQGPTKVEALSTLSVGSKPS
jgi:hypothetical protein